MPLFVFFLLDGFYPEVGYAHSHAVVEADTSVFDFGSETRHTAHLLGYGDGVRVYFVYQPIGEGEVSNGVLVLSAVVVIAVSTESLAQSVVVVKHGGYSVETESVETEFFEPIFTVGEQEMDDLVFPVVETERVPSRVFAAVVSVKKLVGSAVETSQSLDFVFHGMGVNDVHDDGDTVSMGFVDKVFQLVGSAEA